MTTKPRKPKPGHGRVSIRSIESIRPAPENDTLYRPVDPSDPELVNLARDIERNGILDPLVVTADGYLVSGHRRLAAAKLAGLTDVPVIEKPIRRSDPGFVPLLASFNKQREKTLDEKLRESVVEASASEAYDALVSHRIERSDRAISECELIDVEVGRGRCKITKAKWPLLNAVQRVLRDLRGFLPVSDRTIHYQLLNDPPLIHASKPASRYRNDKKSYKALTDILTRARLAGVISFSAIHDPTRPIVDWDVHADAKPHIDRALAEFLTGYNRNLLQSQPHHIEVVGEKNTIEPIIRPVCSRYTVPFTIGRGYCSLAPRYDMVKRLKKSGKPRLVLIVLSDLDPDGDMIAESFARSLRDDFGIAGDREVVPIRAALTREQVENLNLPLTIEAKKTSSNYRRFVERHGTDSAYELEAVPPTTLQKFLQEAIERVLDVDLFNAEVEAERSDAVFIENTRRRAMAALKASMPE
jgi:5S rRNA maturation endonuclease (ribonuclease M5)